MGIGKDELEELRSDILKRMSALESTLSRRVSELDLEIKRKVTDSEQEARSAAEAAELGKGRVDAAVEQVLSFARQIDEFKSAAEGEVVALKQSRAGLEDESKKLQSAIDKLKSSYESILEKKAPVDAAIDESHARLASLEATLSKVPIVESQIEGISQSKAKAEELLSDLNSLQEASVKRSKVIEDVHKNIFGYEVKSKDGTSQIFEGLASELEVAYDGIKERLGGLESEVARACANIDEQYDLVFKSKDEELGRLIVSASGRIDAVDRDLKALLPGAMATGLSAAYESKMRDEVEAQNGYSTYFAWAITALVAISLIPFCIDAYLLVWGGKDIVEVVKGTPSIVASILPLYFPVLWFAYSTNKKLNLSKRLIEEYTHKAVLGKTFSGLSNQIDSLPHEAAIKEELRTKLLFNLLQVSSENPGKLITDYNKSDHPLMDALENSAKLADSVAALSKLPGFSALAEKLASKANRMLDDQTKKVEDGLEVHEELEGRKS